jgi:hypothetical protein
MSTENAGAERAIISAALIGGTGTQGVMALDDSDFTDGRLRVIASVLRDMIRHGQKPDSILLMDELGKRGKLSGPGSAGGPSFVMELATDDAMAVNSGYYAEMVRACTRLRILAGAAEHLAQTVKGDDASGSVDQIAAMFRATLDQIPAGLDAEADDELPTITDLMGVEFTNDWLVPGLIERSERIVVVAGEGAGKSVLGTQAAICLAAGLHPFTGRTFGDPLRVLLIDAENSARQTQRRFGWIGDRVNHMGGSPGWGNRINHQIRPDGLDIPGRDRVWLSQVVAKASPDLIVIGPAYKVMRGDPQKDSDVLALFSALDEIRVRHNCALWIEAHAGHGKDVDGKRVFRPYGSSVWLRWPEVGLGLTRGPGDQGDMHPTELAVGHWRGTREERSWPELIEHGGRSRLPWAPVGFKVPPFKYADEQDSA